jgi:hypothetical protein
VHARFVLDGRQPLVFSVRVFWFPRGQTSPAARPRDGADPGVAPADVADQLVWTVGNLSPRLAPPRRGQRRAVIIDRDDRCAITAKVEREDRRENAEKAEPMEKTDRKEPMEPMDRAEPTDPIDRTDPFEPIDNNEPSDHNDQRDPEEFVVVMI